MMKTYYIPTTILNLGNILSTDSISPAKFYEVRNFGNPHWTKIKENELNNAILLYSTPFSFSCPKGDTENRPMLIQVTIEESLPINEEGICLCDHTIYFDWNTHFIFFSSKDREIAISLCQIGDTSKLLRLYQEKRMVVRNGFMSLKSLPQCNEIPLNEDSIRTDFRINKIKGFLYGYYIGAYLSLKRERVGALRICYEFYARFSSIYSANIYYEEAKNSWGDDTLKIAKEFIDKEEKKATEERILLKPDEEEISVRDLQIVGISTKILDDVEKKLMIYWTNEVLMKDWGRNVNSAKRELLDEITDETKTILAEDWASSYQRAFLNDLRHHIAGEAFHHTINNDLYSSLSIFILKGDDWKDMLELMRKYEMYDYRIAFGFYGAFWGYGSLLHSFTDLLIDQDKKYVKRVYDEFYKLISGKPIPKIMEIDKDISIREKVISAWNKLSPKNKEDLKYYRKMEETLQEVENEPSINISLFLQRLKKKDGWKKSNRIKEFESILVGNLFNK